jgi:hypothetical protein
VLIRAVILTTGFFPGLIAATSDSLKSEGVSRFSVTSCIILTDAFCEIPKTTVPSMRITSMGPSVIRFMTSDQLILISSA